MPTHPKTSALSRYRQFKLQVTQESSGVLSYRVYAKPLSADWSERHCILRGAVQGTPRAPYLTTEDVILGLLAVLEDQTIQVIE